MSYKKENCYPKFFLIHKNKDIRGLKPTDDQMFDKYKYYNSVNNYQAFDKRKLTGNITKKLSLNVDKNDIYLQNTIREKQYALAKKEIERVRNKAIDRNNLIFLNKKNLFTEQVKLILLVLSIVLFFTVFYCASYKLVVEHSNTIEKEYQQYSMLNKSDENNNIEQASFSCQQGDVNSFCLPVHDNLNNWKLIRINSQGQILKTGLNPNYYQDGLWTTVINGKSSFSILLTENNNDFYINTDFINQVPVLAPNGRIALLNMNKHGLDIEHYTYAKWGAMATVTDPKSISEQALTSFVE